MMAQERDVDRVFQNQQDIDVENKAKKMNNKLKDSGFQAKLSKDQYNECISQRNKSTRAKDGEREPSLSQRFLKTCNYYSNSNQMIRYERKCTLGHPVDFDIEGSNCRKYADERSRYNKDFTEDYE